MRCIPISASQTKMEYEVYRANDATDEEFMDVSDFFKQVLKEDKDLCNGAQKNLNAGIFMSGELHPRVEKVCYPLLDALWLYAETENLRVLYFSRTRLEMWS